jgi:hypothetical protein
MSSNTTGRLPDAPGWPLSREEGVRWEEGETQQQGMQTKMEEEGYEKKPRILGNGRAME